METLVVADPKMVEYYGKNGVESYVLAVMNIVSIPILSASILLFFKIGFQIWTPPPFLNVSYFHDCTRLNVDQLGTAFTVKCKSLPTLATELI